MARVLEHGDIFAGELESAQACSTHSDVLQGLWDVLEAPESLL